MWNGKCIYRIISIQLPKTLSDHRNKTYMPKQRTAVYFMKSFNIEQYYMLSQLHDNYNVRKCMFNKISMSHYVYIQACIYICSFNMWCKRNVYFWETIMIGLLHIFVYYLLSLKLSLELCETFSKFPWMYVIFQHIFQAVAFLWLVGMFLLNSWANTAVNNSWLWKRKNGWEL